MCVIDSVLTKIFDVKYYEDYNDDYASEKSTTHTIWNKNLNTLSELCFVKIFALEHYLLNPSCFYWEIVNLPGHVLECLRDEHRWSLTSPDARSVSGSGRWQSGTTARAPLVCWKAEDKSRGKGRWWLKSLIWMFVDQERHFVGIELLELQRLLVTQTHVKSI